MRLKEYPKAVVLKKNLIILTILGVAFIMILLMYNFFNSAHTQKITQSEPNQTISSLAGQADTTWYQTQTIHKEIKSPTSSLQQTKSNTQQATTDQNTAPQIQQDEVKAMSAPISSNQLTASNQNMTPNLSISNNPVAPTGLNISEPDQNKQGEKNAFVQMKNQSIAEDYLGATLQNPLSPYELQAGAIIPGVLITGINSDLPGQITGQVRSNVYDSIAGKYLLIPQGAKLTGLYDSQITYGQARVLVVWNRIIFPNGQSLDLQGMSGVDMSGYAGFKDQVNNHYAKIFGAVILLSALGAGAQLAQPQNSNNPFAAPTMGQTLAQSLGTNLVNTGTMITAKNVNIQPTLEIRPGYEFNIFVKKDIVFPNVYGS